MLAASLPAANRRDSFRGSGDLKGLPVPRPVGYGLRRATEISEVSVLRGAKFQGRRHIADTLLIR